jgi:hypothetical protein
MNKLYNHNVKVRRVQYFTVPVFSTSSDSSDVLKALDNYYLLDSFIEEMECFEQYVEILNVKESETDDYSESSSANEISKSLLIEKRESNDGEKSLYISECYSDVLRRILNEE